jgi:aspartyl-tRNA(Asn)/glutamyl-tRNA(Gln) amidotransferase subunit A
LNTRKRAASSDDLAFATIAELSTLLARRETSPVELAELFLSRIERHNATLNAYLTVTRDEALSAARASEKRFAQKRPRGPLDGIPISLKDNISTAGIRSTAGSKFLANNIPETDATVAAKLLRAGAVLLGKTNLHEFAYGVTTGNPHFGATRNPWDTRRIPGGSSGGSAAALAAGLCVASIGTDTGGSIRIPAALCGVFGLKPTFGRVSVAGVVPLCPSLDHVGPIARTSGDAALLLGIIAGRDSHDATTLHQPALKSFANAKEIDRRLQARFTKKRPLRLGVPREYFFSNIAPNVRNAVNAAARSFQKLGADVAEISMPHVSDGDEPSTTIALAEATRVHQKAGWFPAHAAEYGADVIKRLEMGKDIRATDYLAALDIRNRVRTDFDSALTRMDAILAPTVPMAAPLIGQDSMHIDSAEEPVRGALIRLNRPTNLTGLPAISLPCGWTGENLPIGLQLIGRAWGEEDLLVIARLFEQAHPEFRRRPANF